MERDRCRQDETGQKLDVKKCDGIVKRFTETGDRRGKKARDVYPCTPETCAEAATVVGDLGLIGSSGQSPGGFSSTQLMLETSSLHLGGLLSGELGCKPSENSFSFGVVTPGSSWQSVLSEGFSLTGPTGLSLLSPTDTQIRLSLLEARPSGMEDFFLQPPAGDCGDSGSSGVLDLVVGEKEANVGLSGNGLGMSRIRCARFDDANLLWKDLGDEQFTAC